MKAPEITVIRRTTKTIRLDEGDIEAALKQWAIREHGFTEKAEVTLKYEYAASAVVTEETVDE